MTPNDPAPDTQQAALIARAALIIACIALAVAILGMFLPI
jgi:hypothetical protein